MNIIIVFLLIVTGLWALQHGVFGSGGTGDERRRRSVARYEVKMVFLIIVGLALAQVLMCVYWR